MDGSQTGAAAGHCALAQVTVSKHVHVAMVRDPAALPVGVCCEEIPPRSSGLTCPGRKRCERGGPRGGHQLLT